MMTIDGELDRLEAMITAQANLLAAVLHRLDMADVPRALSEQADRIEASAMDDADVTAPLHLYREHLASIAARLAALGPRRAAGRT